MEEFFLGIVIPIIALAIIFVVLNTIIQIVLDLFKLNQVILKIILFLVAYYFVGNYCYKLLESLINQSIPNFIEILYKPIHFIIEFIKSNI